jgi:exodeoxyribonuclease VII large subunit
MSEIVNDKTVFSLLEVARSMQKTISDRYKNSYWIKAEMNKLNFYRQSGHCYPELVEKRGGKIIAQMKSIIWNDDYIKINNTFLRVLNEPLKDGIKILFLAKITFDPIHGLALTINNIDPSYTLGDLEREKHETIKRLQDEGIFNRNKTLALPLLPQRIAIISVETSKGYADFVKIINGNPSGYKFFHLLFSSLLQGENAVEAIINQLRKVEKVKSHFDVVAIIRGGGGDIGLSCYNDYRLAKEIAKFPIPVITGIGHATNETVCEIISFANAITPTKLAEYLLQKFHDFAIPVQRAEEKVIDKSLRLISEEKNKFQSEVKLFRSVTENILIRHRNDIKTQVQSLFQQSTFRFHSEKGNLFSIAQTIKKETSSFFNFSRKEIKQVAIGIKKDIGAYLGGLKFRINQTVQRIESSSKFLFRSNKVSAIQTSQQIFDKSLLVLKDQKTQLNNLEKNVNIMSPKNVLKRGYSITLVNGKSIKNIGELQKGDSLNTLVFEGNIVSILKSTSKSGDV